jgi:hypothetical protein
MRKKKIGAIDQGLTFLTTQNVQNLVREDLEDYPTSA